MLRNGDRRAQLFFQYDLGSLPLGAEGLTCRKSCDVAIECDVLVIWFMQLLPSVEAKKNQINGHLLLRPCAFLGKRKGH